VKPLWTEPGWNLHKAEEIGIDSFQADRAPDWLRKHASAEWYERYERRIENYHLPKTDAERNQLAITIQRDGQRLLRAIDEASDLRWLCEIPAINTLRQVWAEQYIEVDGLPLVIRQRNGSLAATLDLHS
jgi:transposase